MTFGARNLEEILHQMITNVFISQANVATVPYNKPKSHFSTISPLIDSFTTLILQKSLPLFGNNIFGRHSAFYCASFADIAITNKDVCLIWKHTESSWSFHLLLPTWHKNSMQYFTWNPREWVSMENFTGFSHKFHGV